ncbi:hypothetical protein GW17_00007712 [Ensete ventricosum]|nr:hypothetical protein GW17_00007712 [Ensete ventricosum]
MERHDPTLALQEFMPLTSIQGKLCAFAPCSIFYVDSLHAAWILHQVPPRLLHSSIGIELIVALVSTIPWIVTLRRYSPHYTLQATNTPSSVYKPLHEYRILRVSNSPHLCELCTTLSVITQHLPLYTVSSFTKRPALP